MVLNSQLAACGMAKWRPGFELYFYWWYHLNPASSNDDNPIELKLAQDIIRAEDFIMGGSLSSLSNDIGLRLGTLPGLFVLVVNSDVGWIVGVSSILSNGGGINLDIGNNDGYDEGFCCKRGKEFN